MLSTILKAQRKLIKKGLVKPACIIGIRNKKIETVLGKYGCADLLELDTKAKTVTFKLEFWSKPIKTLLDKIEKEDELRNKIKDHANEKEAAGSEKGDFISEKPLQLRSDFWIVKHRNDHKKILKRWLIKVLGPSPAIGKWHELQAQRQSQSAQTTWKYVLNNPDETSFVLDEGAWFFSGNKPEFDWKSKRWSFSADAPHLYFYEKGGEIHSRFKHENTQVHISENSEFALMREDIILESCHTNRNFDGDSAEGEESSGKSSTEDLGSDRLTGKVGPDKISEEEKAKKKSMYSDVELGGNMSGQSSTDSLDAFPLSGEIDASSIAKEDSTKKDNIYSDAELGGNMTGKSSADNAESDPLSGAINPNSITTKENSHNAFNEGDIPGHLGGPSSTDSIGDGPLSGMAGTPSPEIAGHLSGKSSSDHLGEDPDIGTDNFDEELSLDMRAEKTPENLGTGSLDSFLDMETVAPEDRLGQSMKPSADSFDADDLIEVLPDELGGLTPSVGSNNAEHGFDDGLSDFDDDMAPKHIEVEKSKYDIETEAEDGPDNLSQYKVLDGLGEKKKLTPELEDSEETNDGPIKPHINAAEVIINGTAAEQNPGPLASDPEVNIPKKRPSNIFDDIEHKAAGIQQEIGPEALKEIEDQFNNKKGASSSYSKSSTVYDKELNIVKSAPKVRVIDEKEAKLNLILGAGVNLNLESGLLRVVLKQRTKDGNDIQFICDFEDFYEDELIVKGPKDSLAVGADVQALVSLDYNGKKVKVECSGFVEEVEELSEKTDTLIVRIKEIDGEKYETFIAVYQERQSSINNFMLQAKGY